MKIKSGPVLKFWLAGILVFGGLQLACAGPLDDPDLADELELVLPFYSPACPPPPPPMMADRPAGHRLDGMPVRMPGTPLSDAQSDKVFAIQYAVLPQLRDQAKTTRALQESLRKLAFSSDFDEARLKSLADATARSMAVMLEMRVRLEHQVYALMTPDQRKQFAVDRPVSGPDQPPVPRP